jgi:hypothetical protein
MTSEVSYPVILQSMVTGIGNLLLALAGLPASCEANDEFDHNIGRGL